MRLPTLAYTGIVVRVRSAAAVRAAFGPAPVVAGIATFIAYGCVLAALSRASAASVAAVRETSVVLAAALAAVVLKERVTRWRMVGACAVVAGIALLG
jgi:drug/metabolite transporter (DMT)-like permease